MYPHIYIAISIIFTVQYIQLQGIKLQKGFGIGCFLWDILYTWKNGLRQLFTPIFRCDLYTFLYALTVFSKSGPAVKPSRYANMYCLTLRK